VERLDALFGRPARYLGLLRESLAIGGPALAAVRPRPGLAAGLDIMIPGLPISRLPDQSLTGQVLRRGCCRNFARGWRGKPIAFTKLTGAVERPETGRRPCR